MLPATHLKNCPLDGAGMGGQGLCPPPGDPPPRGHSCMFTPLLIVSVAAAWQLGVNKRLCGSWGLVCAGIGHGAGARPQRGSLRDVDHQVIVPVQGIVPAARVAEHLPRDGAQDRGGRHLGWGQWGQGCPHPGPRTPAREGQRPSHRAVRGSHRHLQQGEETQGGLVREVLDLQKAARAS